ncbi:hypothetical protein EVAR_15083_1 [Eumeta japonica]|uniref:Reverse transcriptase domain-containing protein n=1 Tax=Eumeta variegata TaxID=151549 RepID=A0A4C1YLF7_EUMVA|nr:hypothetical protein EVAR_15083_1 [Eumeta japonica]
MLWASEPPRVLAGGHRRPALFADTSSNKCRKKEKVLRDCAYLKKCPRACRATRSEDLKDYECGPRIDELSVKCFLYADDQAILAPSVCGLQEMANKMNDSVNKKDMKVNVGKTKVMVFERGESATECDILIEGEKVEQVKEFIYLSSLFTSDGKYDIDVEKRVNAGNKMNNALFVIMNSKSVSQQARLAIHNEALIRRN